MYPAAVFINWKGDRCIWYRFVVSRSSGWVLLLLHQYFTCGPKSCSLLSLISLNWSTYRCERGKRQSKEFPSSYFERLLGLKQYRNQLDSLPGRQLVPVAIVSGVSYSLALKRPMILNIENNGEQRRTTDTVERMIYLCQQFISDWRVNEHDEHNVHGVDDTYSYLQHWRARDAQQLQSRW